MFRESAELESWGWVEARIAFPVLSRRANKKQKELS
jgi:hypothetical protein